MSIKNKYVKIKMNVEKNGMQIHDNVLYKQNLKICSIPYTVCILQTDTHFQFTTFKYLQDILTTLLKQIRNTDSEVDCAIEAYYRHYPFTIVKQNEALLIRNFKGYKTDILLKTPGLLHFEDLGNNVYYLRFENAIYKSNTITELGKLNKKIHSKLSQQKFKDGVYEYAINS